MTGRLIFLLEEPSMKALLDEMLPRLFPDWQEGVHFQCIPHQGKSDLDISIPRKLRAWRIHGDRFIIVRDNDGANCLAIKAALVKSCCDSGRPDSLVRLVCQELESWYLGDLAALATAFGIPKLDTPALRKRFQEPDSWHKPSVEVKRLIPSFQKISGARTMGKFLQPANSRSHSLMIFMLGVQRMAIEMGLPMPALPCSEDIRNIAQYQ